MGKRSKQSAPIWTRPAPGTRRPRLTRDQIARAALAIADAEGFAEVSMRRVAAELDAGTMTLYYYVKTKDDLIALMDDALMAEVVLPADRLPPGWRAGLTAIARTSRDVFVRHPWALHALQGARIGPNGLRHMEQSLAALADAPVDLPGKLRLLSIVDDYVFGHVLRVSEVWNHPMDVKIMQSITEFFAVQLATGDYPNLAELIGDDDVLGVFSRLARSMAEDARFETGLRAMLDGLALQMHVSAAPPPPPPPPRDRAPAPGARPRRSPPAELATPPGGRARQSPPPAEPAAPSGARPRRSPPPAELAAPPGGRARPRPPAATRRRTR